MLHKIYTKFLLFTLSLVCVFCSNEPIVKYGHSNSGSLYLEINEENKTTNNNKSTSADFDQDGIENSIDRCVSVPETFNFYKDNDGCPDEFSYSKEPLEIAYIQIFNQTENRLTKNVKELIEIKFPKVFYDYPRTYWKVVVESNELAKEKALAVKTYLDELIKISHRTRIVYNRSEFELVKLEIDDMKAKEIALNSIK